jgi:hypothetical protein
MTDFSSLFIRRAALLRQVAVIDEALGPALMEALATAQRNAERPDETLTLAQAATLVGEPSETFRRRLEYRKALISRPGEHRHRYSSRALQRILADRLATNSSMG